MAVALGFSLTGCAQGRCSLLTSLFGSSTARETRPAEDLSIAFPHFYETLPSKVGMDGGVTELDGRVLRAIQLAADDFLPPGDPHAPCWATQEAHTYRVIRQGDIVFIRLDEDPARCGRKIAALHSGAQYAIGLDGRILRRLIDGQPQAPLQVGPPPPPESPGVPAKPGEVPPHEEGTTPPGFLKTVPQDTPAQEARPAPPAASPVP